MKTTHPTEPRTNIREELAARRAQLDAALEEQYTQRQTIAKLREALEGLLADLIEQRDTGLCSRSRDEQICTARDAIAKAKRARP